jgi:threonine synthase
LEAVFESGGTGVAVDDQDAVDAALTMARRGGPEMCVTSAVAFAGTMQMAEAGVFGSDESVVVINTGAGCKTAGKLGSAASE